MRYREFAAPIITLCTFIAAIWSPLAWMAFQDSFSHNWDPSYPREAWTESRAWFGMTALPFMPVGVPLAYLISSDVIGFALGGAIGGAVFGAFAALVVVLIANHRKRALESRQSRSDS